MSSIIVQFWGARGCIPTPGSSTKIYGGNTACVEILFDDTLFICDAGSGLRLLSRDISKRNPVPSEIHLFLSHAHPAHVLGLPFFEFPYLPGHTLKIHGGNADLDVLKRLYANEGGTGFVQWNSRPIPNLVFGPLESKSEIAGVRVTSFALNHPGGSLGFVFEKEGRKIVYISDHELAIQAGDLFPDPKNETLMMRQMPNHLVDLARGADLLIMDAQHDDEGYSKLVGDGHSSCISATDFALQAEVKTLALFHHDPDSSDLDLEDRVRLCNARTSKFHVQLPIFAAREGLALKF